MCLHYSQLIQILRFRSSQPCSVLPYPFCSLCAEEMWERRRVSLEFSRMVRYESLRNALLGPPVVHEAQNSSRSRCCLGRTCQLGHYCHPHFLHSPGTANCYINNVRKNLPDHFLLHMFTDLVPTSLSNPFLNLLN